MINSIVGQLSKNAFGEKPTSLALDQNTENWYVR